MCQTALNLTERVLPPVPLRRWVFTLPHPLRARLAYDAPLLGAVTRLFVDSILGWYQRHLRTSTARERHQVLLAARLALEAGEAAAEQPTVEVALELTLHERWQRCTLEARRHRRVQRLDVVAHDRIERRRFWATALVVARPASEHAIVGNSAARTASLVVASFRLDFEQRPRRALRVANTSTVGE